MGRRMRIFDDFAIAAGHLTSLPLFSTKETVDPARLAQAWRAAPAVGALVGVLSGAAYWLMTIAGLSTFASAVVAAAVSVAAYGGKQDMAIARAAEIHWGRKSGVEISSTGYDISAIGAAMALLSILMKIALLESIGEPGKALAAMTTACALGQAAWVAAYARWPEAESEEVPADKPAEDKATSAVILGLLVAVVIGWMWGVFAALGAGIATVMSLNMLKAEIGMTREAALGAVQGKAEVVALLIFAIAAASASGLGPF